MYLRQASVCATKRIPAALNTQELSETVNIRGAKREVGALDVVDPFTDGAFKPYKKTQRFTPTCRRSHRVFSVP